MRLLRWLAQRQRGVFIYKMAVLGEGGRCNKIQRRENSLPGGFLGRSALGWCVWDPGCHTGACQVTESGKDCPDLVWVRVPWVCCSPHSVLLSTVLQEGTGASVGTRQVAGQEAKEGQCRGHPMVQGGCASPCDGSGEPVLFMTGLFRVSGVEQKIFMQESDASNFLKKRGKRSSKSRDEVNGKDAGDPPSACPSGSFSLPDNST